MSDRETHAPGVVERFRHLIDHVDALGGFGFGGLLASFAIAALLIVLRGPSFFTHAQFWAEDGTLWYQQAYNQGWLHSLALPNSDYLHILPRLAAGASLWIPLRWAPLVFALQGLLIQALPVPVLLSARCGRWAPLSFRLLFAAVYVAIPNARDIHVVCTNGMWHLALVAVLLAFAAAPRTFVGRVFDVLIFVLTIVSGPFGLVLIPFLFVFWWLRRQRWSLAPLGILIAGGVVQLMVMRHNEAGRHAGYLGATVGRFIRMVGGNIFLGALRGSTAYGQKYPLLACLVVLLVGLAVIAYCSRRAPLEVRLFFLFCLGIMVASLRSPYVLVPNEPYWVVMLRVPSLRYWFFPSLIFLWSLLSCACYARPRAFRAIGLLLALVLLQGMARDWRIPPMADLQFPEYARRFEAAAAGTRVRIPLNPAPDWYMELVKK